MHDHAWFQSILQRLRALVAFFVCFFLLLVESIYFTLFITDAVPYPTGVDYTFFLGITLLKALLTRRLLRQKQESPANKLIAAAAIGLVTLLWLFLLAVGLYAHFFISLQAPFMLLLSDCIAIISNLLIVAVAIGTILRTNAIAEEA